MNNLSGPRFSETDRLSLSAAIRLSAERKTESINAIFFTGSQIIVKAESDSQQIHLEINECKTSVPLRHSVVALVRPIKMESHHVHTHVYGELIGDKCHESGTHIDSQSVGRLIRCVHLVAVSVQHLSLAV